MFLRGLATLCSIQQASRGVKYCKASLHISPTVPSRLLPSDVIISTSNDIYSNLALEDWIYENFEQALGGRELLMIWRNDPCVVVGRHQNVWVESGVLSTRHKRVYKNNCEMPEVTAEASGGLLLAPASAITSPDPLDIVVARRRSGGGAVYHDRGNVNLTFFTNRKRYDRKRNLRLISFALNQQWNLDLSVNERDDLILGDRFKVSGTASKLGGKVAYHHFTLLLNADLSNVSRYLRGIELGVSSKATASVRSSVVNLCSSPGVHISYEEIIRVISAAFCTSQNQEVSWCTVDPMDESLFPKVHSLKSELEKWEWIFGNSPKFTVARNFLFDTARSELSILSLTLIVERGHVKEADISFSDNLTYDWLNLLCKSVSESLIGHRFWTDDLLIACSGCLQGLQDEVHLKTAFFIRESLRRVTIGC